MSSFWQSLPRPFTVLAPMEGVTDTVFRQIVLRCARPDVFFTEFTSTSGFCSPGKEAVAQNFKYASRELPLIAQIWGNNPDHFYRTVHEIAAWGFSGIDINMGCPERNVLRHGCGAALIDDPVLAGRIIEAARAGIADSGTDIPLSIKTRLGNRVRKTEEWIHFLLENRIDALTVHGRTAREMSKVPAHWEEIGKAVEIRNRMRVRTVIIGNGDIHDYKEGKEKYEKWGIDGVMIGRGIFSNLWAFDTSGLHGMTDRTELIGLLLEHVRLYEKTWGPQKNFAALKKFFKIYLNGFPYATDVRTACMALETPQQVISYAEKISG